MDTSVLSIRKALYNSYKNESFKLKERQRHAMAKQRREEMETNRVFKNKLKEIKEKEKEISNRYGQHRMPPVRNQMTKMRDAKVNENITHQRVSVFLPEINASGLGDKEATELYQSEHELSRKRTFNKRRPLRETIRGQNYDKGKMNLTPTLNGNNFTAEYLINYYKSSRGLRGIESSSHVQCKKGSIGTVTFEEQRHRHVGRKETLNTSSPVYDILVIEHGNDDSTSREDDI